MCERVCTWSEFQIPLLQNREPAHQEVISGGKITLVHCCGTFIFLLSDISNGACVLFVMKSMPVGFLNINPRRPINKCNTACRKDRSRSFAIQTRMLQETEGLHRLWEIAVAHPVHA